MHIKKEDRHLPVFFLSAISLSAKENLTIVVNGKNCFTLGATETSCFGSLQFLGTDGAREDFRENFSLYFHTAGLEKSNGFCERILDIEELGKPEQLEYFVYFWLYFEKNDVPAFGFDGF